MDERIRIFVDAHVFDGQFQGTRTFIREMYSLIAGKAVFDLYLGANDITVLKNNFPVEPRIKYIQYKTTSGFSRLAYEIPFLVKKFNIDYAHFQYITPPIKNCKFIVTIHDVIFNEFPEEFSFQYRVAKKFLYKTSAQRADILTTVSNYSADSIEKFLGIKKDNILVTPNGVHGRFFEMYNKQDSKTYIKEKYGFDKFILYVSRIEPRKNHILLLRSFLELKLYEQGYFLVLLGHESIRAVEFNKLYNNLATVVKQFIFIAGEIDDNELLQFYRAADAFVYPSKAEGFGIPPLEAAALKIPVICSDSSAMSDFSFFGDNHVDVADEKLFTNRLREVVANPPGKNDLERISQIVRERYSWKHSAEVLCNRILRDKSTTFDARKKQP